jgi:hypothetical protein
MIDFHEMFGRLLIDRVSRSALLGSWPAAYIDTIVNGTLSQDDIKTCSRKIPEKYYTRVQDWGEKLPLKSGIVTLFSAGEIIRAISTEAFVTNLVAAAGEAKAYLDQSAESFVLTSEFYIALSILSLDDGAAAMAPSRSPVYDPKNEAFFKAFATSDARDTINKYECGNKKPWDGGVCFVNRLFYADYRHPWPTP